MKLTPAERVTAWRLAEGRRVSKDELIEALWGGREDGGPLNVHNSIGVRVHRLRIELFAFGIEIGVLYTYGYQVPSHQIAALRAVLADEIARNVCAERLRNKKSASVSQITALTPKGMDEVYAAA